MLSLEQEKIAVIGLGYVGLPVALSFGRKLPTIGFGIRYATPIGPVRLDLAYQLNPAVTLVPDGLGLGGQKLSRLPRFHFFFNIGSLF